jgi:histidinol-phosphate aminotransferase
MLVTRTFSKHGLAERDRLLAHADIIDAMNRIRLPFTVTTAGQEVADAGVGRFCHPQPRA